MNPAWSVAFAALVPFLCLGLVLWMARLEDTLTDGIVKPASDPEPLGSPLQVTAEVPVSTPTPTAAVVPAAASAA